MDSGIKNDAFYSEMINMMRVQGQKDNPITLQIGIMQSEDSVKIGDLILNSEDLYISDILQLSITYSGRTIYRKLKKGDIVAVQKLNDKDKFVILARVKEA